MPLDRERVVATAVAMADERGIESLSMRALGQRLGVEAMSLYNHVANKSELLDAMVDLVFAEIERPSLDVEWKIALRERAVSARQALRRHPWAIALMDSRRTPGPATLRHHEAVVASLRRAGFTVAATAHAYSLLDSYLYGFTLQEAALPFTSPEESVEVAHEILEVMSPEEFPYLTELAVEHVLQPGYDYADEFEIGLRAIIDTIDRSRDP